MDQTEIPEAIKDLTRMRKGLLSTHIAVSYLNLLLTEAYLRGLRDKRAAVETKENQPQGGDNAIQS